MCVFVSGAAVARLSTVQEVSRLRSRVDASRSSCKTSQCADMRFYRGLLCNDAKIKCICAADSTALDESGGREGETQASHFRTIAKCKVAAVGRVHYWAGG